MVRSAGNRSTIARYAATLIAVPRSARFAGRVGGAALRRTRCRPRHGLRRPKHRRCRCARSRAPRATIGGPNPESRTPRRAAVFHCSTMLSPRPLDRGVGGPQGRQQQHRRNTEGGQLCPRRCTSLGSAAKRREPRAAEPGALRADADLRIVLPAVPSAGTASRRHNGETRMHAT